MDTSGQHKMERWVVFQVLKFRSESKKNVASSIIESSSIYIGNIRSKGLTDAKLIEKFKAYGEIKSYKIIPKDSINSINYIASSSYAFVDFFNAESARNAYNENDLTSWFGWNIIVQVREHRRGSTRRATKAIQSIELLLSSVAEPMQRNCGVLFNLQ
jgi:RNA recognition motif-containing protein